MSLVLGTPLTQRIRATVVLALLKVSSKPRPGFLPPVDPEVGPKLHESKALGLGKLGLRWVEGLHRGKDCRSRSFSGFGGFGQGKLNLSPGQIV